jgi:hypothetical protein
MVPVPAGGVRPPVGLLSKEDGQGCDALLAINNPELAVLVPEGCAIGVVSCLFYLAPLVVLGGAQYSALAAKLARRRSKVDGLPEGVTPEDVLGYAYGVGWLSEFRDKRGQRVNVAGA